MTSWSNLFLQVKESQRAKPKESKTSGGVSSKYWFWGMEPISGAPKVEKPSDDADQQARNILIETPDISAATFLNTLKSKGLKIVDSKLEIKAQSSEADSASTTGVSQLRKQETSRESEPKKNGNLNFRETIRFSALETSARDDGIGPTKFRVVLLQEGLGNLKDAFYYSKDALESAVPLFEGKKMYADHPDAFEEKTRPERSVRDIIGHFENIKVEETDNRHMLVGDAIMLPQKDYEWSRGLIQRAVEFNEKFPDKEFVGLSINASGDAEEQDLEEFMKENEIPDGVLVKIQKAKEQGTKTIRIVRSLKEAVSCDLVTEPGAGGKVLKMLEKEKAMPKVTKAKAKMLEAEDEAKKESEDEAGPDGAHDDADKDKALMAQMLKKHAGVEEGDEAGMKMACEAYEAYREMGMEAEEAGKSTGSAMKLAKHMAAKKEAQDAETEEDAKITPKGYEYAEGEEKRESNRSEIIQLKAEVAKLRESAKKVELKEHLENVLVKSKLPRSATNLFRESIGDLKSKGQIDGDLKLFLSAYNAKGEAKGGFITTEKVTESNSSGLSFADCLK